ncbi:MAG: PQQ-binding-like beta-propeller repeat protein, partial [Planctomycetota bacterium]
AHYSSVMAATINGQPQYVQLLEQRLIALAPSTGQLLWETEWPGRIAVIPTPVIRDNHVYITTGYGVGSKRVTISPDNEVTVDYENKVMKNHHGGVVLLGDHLFGYSDKAGWVCQDFETGESVWRERRDLGKGAISYADGRFYCLDERSGEMVLIAASTDGWQEHGRFTLDPQTELRKPKGKIWMHPVIVNGKLYLRDQELLFCFDVSADSQRTAQR